VGVLHAEGLTDIAIVAVFFSLFFYSPIRISRLRMQTGLFNAGWSLKSHLAMEQQTFDFESEALG